MENAVKALEYAFAILIFVIGLSASIYLLSEVKTTSDNVFSQIDTKQYYVDAEIPVDELTSSGNIKYNGRIVSVETIVPTLYRYYKENYIVEFYEKAEDGVDGDLIIKFDLSQETTTRQLWTGNPEVDAKKRLDLFLNGGGSGEINSKIHELNDDIAFVKDDDSDVISLSDKTSIVNNGFYNYCKGKKFSEEYAYVPETAEGTLDENVTRIVIRYKEVNL